MSDCSDYPTLSDAKGFKTNADTINEVVTSNDDRTSPAIDGKTKITLKGIESEVNSAIENTIGKSYIGAWTQGVTTFTTMNEYSDFNGITYKPKSGATLPYTAQTADPTTAPDNANVEPFSDINSSNLSSSLVISSGSLTPRSLEDRFRERVSVKDFGASGNGVDDDAAAINAAISSVSPTGGIVDLGDGNEYATSQPIILASNVYLIGKSKIINTEISTNTNAVFLAGEFGRLTYRDKTFIQSVSDVEAGSSLVELTSASGLNLGDMVFCRSGDYSSISGDDIYFYGMINQIIGITGNTITLRYPVDDYSVTLEVCQANEAIHDAGVVGPSIEVAQDAKLFREGGGCLNCHFDFDSVQCDSIVFTNAWAYSSASINYARFDRHAFELGLNSRHNSVSMNYAEITTTGSVGKNPIRTSESLAFTAVNINRLNVDIYNLSEAPVYVSAGVSNAINIGVLDARSALEYVVAFASQAYTPSSLPLYNNTITVKEGYCGNSQGYIKWSSSGVQRGNAIKNSSFYGDVSQYSADVYSESPSIVNCNFESGQVFVRAASSNQAIVNTYSGGGFGGVVDDVAYGNPLIRNNSSEQIELLYSSNQYLNTVTVPSGSLSDIKSVTYSSGELEALNYIDVEAVFRGSAAVTGVEMDLTVGGVTVASYSVADGTDPFSVKSRIFFDSTGVTTTSTTPDGQSSSFQAIDYDLGLTVSLRAANTGGTGTWFAQSVRYMASSHLV